MEMKKGNLTDKKSTKVLGRVTDVKVEPTKDMVTTANGKIVEADVPERYTCYVTIEADGKRLSSQPQHILKYTEIRQDKGNFLLEKAG